MATTLDGQTDSKLGLSSDADPLVMGELWDMANTIRGSMDATEYKHVILGLIFLKYVSDSEERKTGLDSTSGPNSNERGGHCPENTLWVPPEGRWASIQAQARQPTIGQTVDCAMSAIERENPAIKNVLPKNYAKPSLDKTRLGRVVDLVGNIRGDQGSKLVLGRTYEYFLSRFASIEGKKGGESYTPRSVARLVVEMLRPHNGRVYDPCCGTSGMLVQLMEFAHMHAESDNTDANISVYGQEPNRAAWQLARMNLAIHGMDGGQILHGDGFHNDRHSDLKADLVLASPPFNASKWGEERLREEQRWAYGVPPKNNANFAWVQYAIHHLAPFGVAGLVLANGSMSSDRSGEGEIRKNVIEANLVDCMVALPGQLFYSTSIPACLWFLSRDRHQDKVLFIDARHMGHMVDKTRRELGECDINDVAAAYHSWRDGKGYADVPGFCKSVPLGEIRKNGHVLTPGSYVGDKPQPDDEPFEEKMTRLVAQWNQHQVESEKLDTAIAKNIKKLGFAARGAGL